MSTKQKKSILLISLLVLIGCGATKSIKIPGEEDRVVQAADKYMQEEPETITSFTCERSEGGIHDYYSEGDYWWPDPENPDGPYIRKDGLTNPNNFTMHRKAIRRLSIIVPTLVAAYKATGNVKYAEHALKHLNAWFVDANTRMNPNLLYAQAIKGRVSGRGIGIIDTIHLVEVAKALQVLNNLNAVNEKNYNHLKKWFAEYLQWMTTHKFGIEERDNGNNHSTCWAMQVAMFASLTENEEQLEFVRDFYKEILIPSQVAKDGSFPEELKRTKPYGYSIFNLDIMAMVCEIASNKSENLWLYTTKDGRSIKLAMEFMYPYLENKNKWSFQKDVMYWDEWPVRQPSLLFASISLNEPKYYELWKTLDPNPNVEEVIRNYPIRQPLLWID